MSINAFVSNYLTLGYKTETAATIIEHLVPGKEGERLALLGYNYTAAATAHTLSIMYPGAAAGCRNTSADATAKDQKVVNVVTAPVDPAGNAVASGDIVAYQLNDGTWEFNSVASLSTKAITLTTNVAVAFAAGNKFMVFGIAADGARTVFGLTASVTTSKYEGVYFVAPQKGDPIVVQSDNATNAGFLNSMLFAYINK